MGTGLIPVTSSGNLVGGKLAFLPFKKALARSLKLKSKTEWMAWGKSGGREANVPSHSDKIYQHDGWQGYGHSHWLGTGNVCGGNGQGQKFLPFEKAPLYARTLKLKSHKE